MYTRVAVVILFIIIFSEMTIITTESNSGVNIDIKNISTQNNTLHIKYLIASSLNYPINIRVAILAKKSESIIKSNVYIYFDKRYPVSGADWVEIIGVQDHVFNEFRIRNQVIQGKVVNADELRELMLDLRSANKNVLIIPTGTFPDTVFTKKENLVKPWVEAGGMLIWGGADFAYYSARKGERLSWQDSWHPGTSGEVQFFGIHAINHNQFGEIAMEESINSKVFGLKYSFISRGVSLGAVEVLKGKTLGKIGKNSTSIAYIPVGNGKIIIFGGELPIDFKFYYDISQILWIGDEIDSPTIGYKDYRLTRGMKLLDEIIYDDNTKNYSNMTMLVFQTDDEGGIFIKKDIRIEDIP